MKNIFGLFVLCMLIISCTKEPITSSDTKPFLKFKADGKLYEFNELTELVIDKNTLTSPSIYKYAYYLSADNSTPGVGISLRFMSKSSNDIAIENYYLAFPVKENGSTYSVGEAWFNGVYYINKTGDFSTVNITKIENGSATGTFNSSLTTTIGNIKTSITEGVFRNIKIIQ